MPPPSVVVPLDLIPGPADLPGTGWTAIDEDAEPRPGRPDSANLFDGVGPGFPDGAVVDTAASAHFLRDGRTLVHGFAASFTRADAAKVAESMLAGSDFACGLARSVAADLDAQPVGAEVLAADVVPTDAGHRVRFTGGDGSGLRPVHLDVIVARVGAVVAVYWFADSPHPFDPADRDHVIDRVWERASA